MAFCAKCGAEIPAGATFCPACGTPVGQTSGATPMSAPVSGFDTLTKDSKAQSYWVERVVAYIVDAIIVYAIFYVLLALAAVSFLFSGGMGIVGFGLIFGTFAFLGGLIFVLYFAVTESSSGASIGKRVFSLKVKSKTGSNPTFTEALIRNVSKIYWLLLLLDVIVGLATSKGYQQKWTDKYAGTTVVSTKA